MKLNPSPTLSELLKATHTRDGCRVHIYEAFGNAIYGRVLRRRRWVAMQWNIEGREYDYATDSDLVGISYIDLAAPGADRTVAVIVAAGRVIEAGPFPRVGATWLARHIGRPGAPISDATPGQ